MNIERDALAWFPILAKRHDAGAPRIARLRGYTNGAPPLPEMNKNTRASWESFQRKACLNLGGLIVTSAASRIRLAGIVIGEERGEAETRVRRIMRDNRFEAVLSDAVTWALTDGQAYLMNAVDEKGRAVITAESAEHVTVSVDPLRPWSPRAALKVWRDGDAERDYAYVWDGTNRVRFGRPIRDRKGIISRVHSNNWEIEDVTEVDGVPLVILQPQADGLGTFESHTDVIDRVHLGILNRLVTMALQAFKQRAIKGALPTHDEAGNPIDYDKEFDAAPGAIWQLPPGVDIWESPATAIDQLLNAERTNLRDLAAVTRTRLSSLNPEGANQSAEGAAAAKEGEISRVQGYLERMVPGVELVLVRALRSEDPDALEETDTVTVLFKPPQVISETERMAALVQAKGADVPWRTRMLSVGAYSADEVDRMEIERAMEQINMAAFELPATAPAPSGGPAAVPIPDAA